MKVFISWSGTRSREIAAALSDWLPDILQDLDTWLSSHDIQAGSRWGRELHEQLQATHFGILCLTPENIQAPWLLFEAGSLAKVVESARVVPYCLGLTETDVPYPLAQFQGVSASKSGSYRLLESLNTYRESAMSNERLERLFDKWWPELKERLRKIPDSVPQMPQPRADRALLEEILQLVRRQTRSTPESPGISKSEDPPEVWKTIKVWQVSAQEIADMATEELLSYHDQLQGAWRASTHLGKDAVLERNMKLAEKEIHRRPISTESRGEARNEKMA